MTPQDTLLRAYDAVVCEDGATGLSALARALSSVSGRPVSPQQVDNWFKRKNVPMEHCCSIEQVTERAVTCEELRPDLARQWAYLRGSGGA